MTARRILTLAFLAGFALAPMGTTADTKKDNEKSKAALQELGEFIGQWNGNGEGTVEGKKALWKETWSWGWKFGKDTDPALKIDIKDGKFFSKAEVKYDLEKKLYLITATDKDGKDQDFTGKLAKGKFILERSDAKTKDLYRLTLNTAAEGSAPAPSGRTNTAACARRWPLLARAVPRCGSSDRRPRRRLRRWR